MVRLQVPQVSFAGRLAGEDGSTDPGLSNGAAGGNAAAAAACNGTSNPCRSAAAPGAACSEVQRTDPTLSDEVVVSNNISTACIGRGDTNATSGAQRVRGGAQVPIPTQTCLLTLFHLPCAPTVAEPEEAAGLSSGAGQDAGRAWQHIAGVAAAAAGPARADGPRRLQDRSAPGPDAEVPSVEVVEAVVPCMSGDNNHAVVPGKPDAGSGSKPRCL